MVRVSNSAIIEPHHQSRRQAGDVHLIKSYQTTPHFPALPSSYTAHLQDQEHSPPSTRNNRRQPPSQLPVLIPACKHHIANPTANLQPVLLKAQKEQMHAPFQNSHTLLANALVHVVSVVTIFGGRGSVHDYLLGRETAMAAFGPVAAFEE